MHRFRRITPSVVLTLGLLAWAAVAPALSGPYRLVDDAMRAEGLNRADMERRERGYYEQLLDAGQRLDSGTTAGRSPQAEPAVAGPALTNHLTVAVEDARETALKTAFTTEHLGARWTTNEMGLRDREYSRTKPAGTIRLALLGDSIGAGWGVADGEGFEPRLERALDEASRSRGGPAVEVLNFAVPGHAPGQRWEHFVRTGGWDLGIDAILYEATPADVGWDAHRLRRTLWLGSAFEAAVYRETLSGLGLEPGLDVEAYKRRVRPYRWEVLEGVYRHVARESRRRGVPVAWFMIPRVGKANDAEDRVRLIATARAVEFDPVLDLSHGFDGNAPERLAVAPGDYHPNSEGHALIAGLLEERLSGGGLLRDLESRADGPAAGREVLPR